MAIAVPRFRAEIEIAVAINIARDRLMAFNVAQNHMRHKRLAAPLDILEDEPTLLASDVEFAREHIEVCIIVEVGNNERMQRAQSGREYMHLPLFSPTIDILQPRDHGAGSLAVCHH